MTNQLTSRSAARLHLAVLGAGIVVVSALALMKLRPEPEQEEPPKYLTLPSRVLEDVDHTVSDRRYAIGDMAPIPGGTFVMGATVKDVRAPERERPRHEVTVDPFFLDRYEVTVGQYRSAVEAGLGPPPGCRIHYVWEVMMCNWYWPDALADHPVNGVTWFMANDYCKAMGKRLPTEAEMEFVLKTGSENGGMNPWGDHHFPDGPAGNYAGEEFPEFLAESARLSDYRDDHVWTSPVGYYPADRYGIHDLSGNVWEWTGDWFDPDYYGVSLRDNPTGPETGGKRVLRGGNFHCVPWELRVSERHPKPPDDGSVYSGFRCARSASGKGSS